jgi:P-type Cu2+ transporter
VASRELRLGQAAFALPAVHATQPFDDAVVLADAAGPIAAFRLSERLRSDARGAMDALREGGLKLMIASGDAHTKVAAVASELRIPDWRARQLPADKLNWLGELRAAGARVIAVGDGVNDAPVLAGSDLAIALADGADIARAGSDIVLADGRLMALPFARAVARQTMVILHQNQRWALCYNLTVVPVAALGLVPPWLAALGMSLSSLCVILNALRIGRDASAHPELRTTTGLAPLRGRTAAA